jgi:hypothetical protein
MKSVNTISKRLGQLQRHLTEIDAEWKKSLKKTNIQSVILLWQAKGTTQTQIETLEWVLKDEKRDK